jgi:hypothetical protein
MRKWTWLLLIFSLFATGASAQQPLAAAKSAHVTLTYLGTAGWQISDDGTVILVDPYLSRILVPPSGPGSAALGRVPGDTQRSARHLVS